MYDISTQAYIKDLMIFKIPTLYEKIARYVNESRSNGVNLGDLVINPYIYESRHSHFSFLVNYIYTLNNLVRIFRELYDDRIYALRQLNLINDDIYSKISDDFQIIFRHINDNFNTYIDDAYLFEYFGIYMSEISLEANTIIYTVFNEVYESLMRKYVDYNILKSQIIKDSINFPRIYDKLFEQFESIYLPFY